MANSLTPMALNQFRERCLRKTFIAAPNRGHTAPSSKPIMCSSKFAVGVEVNAATATGYWHTPPKNTQSC
jgi:hypothetical protein